MLSIIGIVLAWLACGVLPMGWSYAYNQRAYREIAHTIKGISRVEACVSLAFGPSALLYSLVIREFRYGWLAPWRREEQDEPNA